MAGDWIKMRANLHTHPKVVRIASALKADRLRIVGGLHAVWCLFDAHSEDGTLSGYTPDAVDELIGFEGFAGAMCSVKWLTVEADGVALPEFDEHNGQSAKRRASETKRKRLEREEGSAESGRNMSASDADKKRTREEKRREEKKEELKSKTEAPATPLPDWIPADSWVAFLAMRKAIKKPITPDAIPLAIKKLASLRDGGNDPKAVLEQSTMNCWQGLFEVKPDSVARSSPMSPASKLGKAGQETAQAAQRLIDKFKAENEQAN